MEEGRRKLENGRTKRGERLNRAKGMGIGME
jgi:hypothetical protein